MKVKIEKGKLIIIADIERPKPSKSGKTMVIASSYGNQKTEAMYEGKPVVVGFNAYVAK